MSYPAAASKDLANSTSYSRYGRLGSYPAVKVQIVLVTPGVPNPSRIVWQQDDVTRRRSYWLATKTPKPKTKIVATLSNQQIHVENDSFDSDLQIRLNDSMIDLDKNVEIYVDGKLHFSGIAERTIHALAKTLNEYGDPNGIYSTEIAVNLKSENNSF